ncbi:hypothetical protein MauCBS54593_002038 [Microsporum audouinii]
MQTLLWLEWFSRVWCKQEIWAARKASLRYEDISCEWQNFDVDFFERMVASTTADVQSVPGMTRAMQSLARIRDQHVRADGATLASARDKDTRNPYIHEEDGKRNETLPVSYSEDQSTAKTYEDLARHVIGRDDSLPILFLEGVFDHQQPRGEFNKQPLPTGVPDWGRDYGSLKWLTSSAATPLSEKTLQLVQIGPQITTAKQALSGVRFPLLVCEDRVGIFNGETLSSQRSSSTNGLRHAEIVHIKAGLLSMSDRFCERLTDGPPTELYPGFVQDRVSISGMVWAVPKKARAGDVAIAVHGAYALLLVRPYTDNLELPALQLPSYLSDTQPKTKWPYPCDQIILLFSPSCENCGADQAGTRHLTNNLVELFAKKTFQKCSG